MIFRSSRGTAHSNHVCPEVAMAGTAQFASAQSIHHSNIEAAPRLDLASVPRSPGASRSAGRGNSSRARASLCDSRAR